METTGPRLFLSALEPDLSGELFVTLAGGTTLTLIVVPATGTERDLVVRVVSPVAEAAARATETAGLTPLRLLRAMIRNTPLPGVSPAPGDGHVVYDDGALRLTRLAHVDEPGPRGRDPGRRRTCGRSGSPSRSTASPSRVSSRCTRSPSRSRRRRSRRSRHSRPGTARGSTWSASPATAEARRAARSLAPGPPLAPDRGRLRPGCRAPGAPLARQPSRAVRRGGRQRSRQRREPTAHTGGRAARAWCASSRRTTPSCGSRSRTSRERCRR